MQSKFRVFSVNEETKTVSDFVKRHESESFKLEQVFYEFLNGQQLDLLHYVEVICINVSSLHSKKFTYLVMKYFY